jgi:hypothetical protein
MTASFDLYVGEIKDVASVNPEEPTPNSIGCGE